MREINDPVETIIADALTNRGVAFRHESEGAPLDFEIIGASTYIEVKQFHTDRTNDQLSRFDNVIVVQGVTAALCFSDLLARDLIDGADV